MNKKKILITGISGLLGSNLAYCLKRRYQILGWYHSYPIAIGDVYITKMDLSDKQKMGNFLKEFVPDVVIHCAAQANVDICEENPKLAQDCNVKGTQNLAESLDPKKTKLIHISTDLVYDGKKGRYKEEDALHPLNVYAKTKVKAEAIVSQLPQSVILRTNFFGWNARKDKYSLGEWVIQELTHHRLVVGFRDVYFSSLYTVDLAEIIRGVITKNLSGIFNCGTRTAISKFDFLKMVAKKTGLPQDYIKSVSVDKAGLKAKRSKNLSLDTAKLSKGIGRKLPTIEETVNRFVKDYENEAYLKIRNFSHKVIYPQLETIPYGRQSIDEDDIAVVVEVLKSRNLTQGPKIEEFEKALCVATDAKFAVAVNSGTSALHIACLAVGVGPGDEVVTSANTFVASANCAVYCGAKPVFADIDPTTYNISAQEIEKKITPQTKAVIPVHFAGQSCDMEAIREVIQKKEQEYGHKIYIIEDACHALGSKYKNTKVGSCAYSDMVILSFHPVKHITTGEGGAVLAKDKDLVRRLQYLRSHGITSAPEEFEYKDNALDKNSEGHRRYWYYEQKYLGFNYRITDIQCALGSSQLKKLELFRKRRREIVDFYNRAFGGLEHIQTPFEAENCDSSFHLYVLLFDFKKIGITRAQLMAELKTHGIATQVHYIPVYTHPFYQNTFGTKWRDCQKTERYYEQCLSIPVYASMTLVEAQKIVSIIKNIVFKNKT
ncbi:MAG: UDP-4-amino-4,6-dideoxy-N-acetyl-beta-L-altrosamine transaminase [Candidatus Omnitrophica bacterium]|nr:UDP-4-amino-4,6-dideoxy-N-acetyl-beta-L-altrosamine transaminase [Candidatus Omnitrophota bacterium]